MILIPYSKNSYRTSHSINETKGLLVEYTGIKMDNDNSKTNKNLFAKYKGEIIGNDFEIIEKQTGKDIWVLRIKGQLLSKNEETNIRTIVILNYTSWILFLIISFVNLGLMAGIYLYSKISGELNPVIWDLLMANLFFYGIYLAAYHLRTTEMTSF